MADLTTLEKAQRQINGNNPVIEAASILSALITSSSAWVEREVGGDLMRSTITETRDGNGECRIRLGRSHSWRPGNPATTVTSVTVDGATIPARPAVSSSNTNPSGWVYREDGVDLVGYRFTEGTANVVVVYSAGYDTVPADVEQAVLEHIALRFKDRGHAQIDSSSDAGQSVSFGSAGTLAFIEGVLSSYRVMGIG